MNEKINEQIKRSVGQSVSQSSMSNDQSVHRSVSQSINQVNQSSQSSQSSQSVNQSTKSVKTSRVKSGQAKPSQAKPSHVKSSQVKSGQVIRSSGHKVVKSSSRQVVKSGQARPGQVNRHPLCAELITSERSQLLTRSQPKMPWITPLSMFRECVLIHLPPATHHRRDSSHASRRESQRKPRSGLGCRYVGDVALPAHLGEPWSQLAHASETRSRRQPQGSSVQGAPLEQRLGRLIKIATATCHLCLAP